MLATPRPLLLPSLLAMLGSQGVDAAGSGTQGPLGSLGPLGPPPAPPGRERGPLPTDPAPPALFTIGEGVSCPEVAPPLGGWLSLESRNESLVGVGAAGGALAPGAVLLFACRAGYRLAGGARITCSLRDGTPTWSDPPPVCQEDEMGYRVAVLASVVSGALILVLSTAFVSCCLRSRRLQRQQQRQLQQQRRHGGGHGEGHEGGHGEGHEGGHGGGHGGDHGGGHPVEHPEEREWSGHHGVRRGRAGIDPRSMEFVEEREVGGRTGRERARGRGYDNVGFHGPDDALPTLCSAGYQIFPFAPGQPAPAGLPPGCIPIAVLALPLPDLPRHAAPPPPGPPGRASYPQQAGKSRASRKCAR
ncbi:uncharacterized protein LOC133349590 [Lethenteron reissneri]|uniref:uncharacterized protein LOC133349590 n=1 Tax=Lethenteron reissneri TaxID=7753 RepID=UPI002AB6F827|nr:uncharacterized protein LOC133349590 [Lethenteron reissneri]